MRFYKCNVCGKIIAILNDKQSIPTVCCTKEMQELTPNTTDGAHEKHVPVFEVKDNKVCVTVGENLHPMTKEHFIEWIFIETKSGNQRVILKPDCEPKATFALLPGDELKNVYAYCNLHGLWKA